ncbi:MAG: helix-turn-helix domain-containing protein [Ruminiclostridium sp.]
MKLTDKLDILMSEKGINKMELAKQSGVPYTTIVNFYEKGTDNIKLSTLTKLKKYFNVSLDYLADDNINERNISESSLSKEEKYLFSRWSKLSREEQLKMLGRIEAKTEE